MTIDSLGYYSSGFSFVAFSASRIAPELVLMACIAILLPVNGKVFKFLMMRKVLQGCTDQRVLIYVRSPTALP